jgi:hypothetical protein
MVPRALPNYTENIEVGCAHEPSAHSGSGLLHTERMTSTRASPSTGFLKKAVAPRSRQKASHLADGFPVMRIIGTSQSLLFKWSSSPGPPICPISTSAMIQLLLLGPPACRNCSAEIYRLASYPYEARRFTSDSRTRGSSSLGSSKMQKPHTTLMRQSEGSRSGSIIFWMESGYE